MKVLVLGANGATGFHVVTQLLKKGIAVKAVARNIDKFESVKTNKQLELLQASILEITDAALREFVCDVDAVISCLGHNITLKGLFGKPRMLLADALTRTVSIMHEIHKNRTIKIILMNTTACTNKLQNEQFGGKESVIMNMLRYILPPQRDNEAALEFLIEKVGTGNNYIEWVAVRPDALINLSEVSAYTIHTSVVRSPLFNPGKTSRINVADFMARLLTEEKLWEQWKYKTPVIYNNEVER